MANDSFLHDEGNLSSLVGDLSTYVSTYGDNISSLDNYISYIEGSNSWVDPDVKTAFIAAARSYINSYKIFYAGLNAYVQCLSTKNENLADNENVFS